MKIALHNSHVPYNYDFARIDPDWEIHVERWVPEFRPVPPNVQIVPREDLFIGDYDVFVGDVEERGNYSLVQARKKIHIFHCENFYDPFKTFGNFHEQVDWMVCVSSNKAATYRDYSWLKNFVVINLAVSENDFPMVDTAINSVVGVAWNWIVENQEVLPLWEQLSSGFDSVVIGNNGGRLAGSSRMVFPNNFDEYRQELGRLAVYIHPMQGNICGYGPREGLCSGIPLVTAVVPELYSFAMDGWNMFISRGECKNKIDEMRARIKRLLDDHALRSRMGKSGSESVRRAYPMETFKRKWRELIL